MRITLAAVGRAKEGPERALFDHFAARLSWPLSLREVEEKRPLSAPERKAREAALLLDATPGNARLIALDERGRSITSTAFADLLGRWRDEGRDAAFVIGGADGLDASIREKADLVLALGPMTWPHMLVRALLAEQLYRAQCILAGHPYHRS